MEEKQDFHITKYHGNNKYFAALCKNENNNYFILFALTHKIDIIKENESIKCYGLYHTILTELMTSCTVKAEIIFKVNSKLNTISHIIQLNNEQEFDSIIKILECIL